MKQKIIRMPVRRVRDYVRLLNGIFELTPTELDVLAAFVELHLKMQHARLPANAFSTDGRKMVAKALGKDADKQHAFLGPYVKSLKDKGAITPIPGGYQIDERLIPQGEAEIVLKIK